MAPSLHKKPLIYLGPSLPREIAISILDADYRPPIRRGDLVQAVREGFRIIGIIDGVFHQEIAVSLQEIRLALQQGAQLYGASSMGALRAAEAYPLGMIGIGVVYSWYRSEKIDSDDEVALCFNEATGQALSEALVNIRATLDRAQQEEVIDGVTKEIVLAEASQMHFTERSYKNLFHQLTSKLGPGAIEDLKAFVTAKAVDLKAQDAMTLLRAIKAIR